MQPARPFTFPQTSLEIRISLVNLVSIEAIDAPGMGRKLCISYRSQDQEAPGVEIDVRKTDYQLAFIFRLRWQLVMPMASGMALIHFGASPKDQNEVFERKQQK